MSETAEDILGPTCEFCHGSGQPVGIKGGPELGLCSWCGGSGHSRRAVPDHVFATPDTKAGALRADKPFSIEQNHSKPNDAGVFMADFRFRKRHEIRAGCNHLEEHRFVFTCGPETDIKAIEAEARAYLAQPEQPALGAEPPVTLASCPVGLFCSANGELCFKSEYGNNEGRIDAYIVSSGEFFWGSHPQTIENQRKQLVSPVVYTAPPVSPDVAALQAEISKLKQNGRTAIDAGEKMIGFCATKRQHCKPRTN